MRQPVSHATATRLHAHFRADPQGTRRGALKTLIPPLIIRTLLRALSSAQPPCSPRSRRRNGSAETTRKTASHRSAPPHDIAPYRADATSPAPLTAGPDPKQSRQSRPARPGPRPARPGPRLSAFPDNPPGDISGDISIHPRSYLKILRYCRRSLKIWR